MKRALLVEIFAERERRHSARRFNVHEMGLLRHLWWRFHWAPADTFNRPGLFFWAGEPVYGKPGWLRLWGEAFLTQLLIVALTVPAMWMAGGSDARLMFWGFVLLLASQPLWLWATLRSAQFGMFLMGVIYTGLWLRAVINHL